MTLVMSLRLKCHVNTAERKNLVLFLGMLEVF
jgi:hypothetical protein